MSGNDGSYQIAGQQSYCMSQSRPGLRAEAIWQMVGRFDEPGPGTRVKCGADARRCKVHDECGVVCAGLAANRQRSRCNDTSTKPAGVQAFLRQVRIHMNHR